ncbi:MAG: hypothetical protein ABSA92_05755 [Candidatus Bathyarchaeia archaeon]
MTAKQRRKPQRRRAQCGDLQIEIRSSGATSSMYMFSAKGKTLAQANLQNDSVNKLKRLPAEFSSFLEEDKPTNSNRLGITSEIRTLRYGLRGVSFKARIVQKSSVRAVSSKDGTPLLVCDVTLSDGTGEIPLAVWNNQIGTVAKGDLIQIENARVRSFRGKIQLSLHRKTGVLTVLEHTRLLPS